MAYLCNLDAGLLADLMKLIRVDAGFTDNDIAVRLGREQEKERLWDKQDGRQAQREVEGPSGSEKNLHEGGAVGGAHQRSRRLPQDTNGSQQNQ